MRALLVALCALFVSVPATAQTALPTGKLPDQVAPIAYRLDMTILPGRPRFSGHAEIDVTLKATSTSVFMHGRGLHVTKAVAQVGAKSFPVTFTQKTPTGLAQLDFGRSVPAGPLTLKFNYDAPFATGPAGLYHLDIAGDWYSWTQFESIDARSAFPSFDEPGFKTPFTVSIATKPGFVAASNAAEIGQVRAGALVKHRFAPTKPLPTYLVAFVTGPFAVAKTVVPPTPQRPSPLPLRVIGTKPNAGQLNFALQESGKIVALLERYFDQPFPFPKLDQIGSPVMPGAMENAGADIYGDGILFLDEASPSEDKKTFGMVVAHELSHQWFGDLVTPAWWDDIWLNESFANWMGFRIGSEWRPGLNIEVDAIDEGFDAMNLDALAAGRPIHERITRDADVDAAFDQITYGKGGQVVAMIAAYLGDDKFRDGVRLHMKRHAYGNASTDAFFASLADGAHDPRVLASLRSFVDQQGVPVVTLHRQGDTLTATQARYAYFGSNLPAQQWIVPLCVRSGETRSCTLMDQPTAKMTVSATRPMVPNAGGWGYYRFDMDAADWRTLIAATPSLTQGEALATADSLWASFYAGKAQLPEGIALSRAMAAYPAPKIAMEGASRLTGLAKRGLVDATALPAYRKLLGELYRPMLDKLGLNLKQDAYAAEGADTRKQREDLAKLLANDARDAALRRQLSQALDASLAGDATALDPDYLELAVSVTVNERGVPFAKTLAAKATANQTLEQPIGAGITHSGNAEVARWFLYEYRAGEMAPLQRSGLAVGFLASPETRDVASTFVLDNFDALSKASGGGGIFSGRSADMFNGLCTTAQADRVDAKLRPTLSTTLNLDRVVETIRNCARFREAKHAEVSAALTTLAVQ